MSRISAPEPTCLKLLLSLLRCPVIVQDWPRLCRSLGGMRSKGGLWPIAFLVAVAFAAFGASAAGAEEIYPMYFPVVGDVYYGDTWGAARSGGRTHEGTDIMTYEGKGVPVVAVASGTVGWMHDELGGKCCAMALHHDDGWTSWYIHLNNDTPGTDDGQGWGFAPGIATGVHVEAGELIALVGDSGNAENVAPHLHFELHKPEEGNYQGEPINPYEHLLAATVLTEPIDPYFTPPFRDDDGSPHEENIILLYELGITYGCAEEYFCVADPVTRGQMAAFLNRALSFPAGTRDYFTDDDSLAFQNDINALAEAGVTTGCGEALYCPGDPVTRAQMATFLVRAFDLPPVADDFFGDDEGLSHEANINALAAAGVTTGCSAESYCPGDAVTRAQMASFIARALATLEG